MDNEFDIIFKIGNFQKVKNNLTKLNFKLAFRNDGNDHIYTDGLISVDFIQLMEGNKITKCIHWTIWTFPLGIAPPGNSQHLLHKKYIAPARVKRKALENWNRIIITRYSFCYDARMNIDFNLKKRYPKSFQNYSTKVRLNETYRKWLMLIPSVQPLLKLFLSAIMTNFFFKI